MLEGEREREREREQRAFFLRVNRLPTAISPFLCLLPLRVFVRSPVKKAGEEEELTSSFPTFFSPGNKKKEISPFMFVPLLLTYTGFGSVETGERRLDKIFKISEIASRIGSKSCRVPATNDRSEFVFFWQSKWSRFPYFPKGHFLLSPFGVNLSIYLGGYENGTLFWAAISVRICC